MKKVTFDFDGTLDQREVQEYAKELMEKGVDVWVLTSRFDEEHKHLYPHNPTNEDMYRLVETLGIPKEKIIFTNMEMKLFSMENDISFHLDNDMEEIISANDWGFHNFVYYHKVASNWQEKCNELLNK